MKGVRLWMMRVFATEDRQPVACAAVFTQNKFAAPDFVFFLVSAGQYRQARPCFSRRSTRCCC